MRDVADEEDEEDAEDVEDLVEDQIDDRTDPLLPEPKDRDKLQQAVLPELTTLTSTRSLLFNRFRTEDVVHSCVHSAFGFSLDRIRIDSYAETRYLLLLLCRFLFCFRPCILLLWTSIDTQFNEL